MWTETIPYERISIYNMKVNVRKGFALRTHFQEHTPSVRSSRALLEKAVL
jgi:hypothetical protein